MHEWSLGQAVISGALDYAKKHKLKRAIKIGIVLGELQQIDLRVFRLALKELIKEQQAYKIKFKIKEEKATLKCRACGFEWSFSKTKKKLSKQDAELIHFVPDVAHAYMRCPKCKSPDFEIVKGRGVRIESVEEISD